MSDPGRWLASVAATCLAAGVAVTIVSTSAAMSQTWDEPIHISTGLEWLQQHRYTMWTETPPLARIAVALGPHWNGVQLDGGAGGPINAGNAALYRDGQHQRHLREARLGTLPFFVLLLLVVWHWSGRAKVPEAQFFSLAMVATLPAMIAHAAVATTDIASTATFVLATYALIRWIERPAWSTAMGMSFCFAVALSTKFSVVMFSVPVALAVALVWFSTAAAGRAAPIPRVNLKQIVAGLAVVALVVWGSYGFSVGTIAELPPTPGSRVSAGDGLAFATLHWIEHARLPAPEFPHGLLALAAHNRRGQAAYALGETSRNGFWYFYPLALAVKTPLPFLLLALAAGLSIVWRRRLDWSAGAAGAAAIALLLGALSGRVNLGLRHVLAVYPFAAIAGGMITATWLRSPLPRVRATARLAATALVAAQLFTLWRIHPDELAYFNAIAGPDHGRVLVDSDLDWGQDLHRLEAEAQQRGIDHLQIAYFGTARLCEPGMPRLTWLLPGQPVTGWIAISETYYRGVWRPGRRDVCDLAAGWASPPRGADYSWLQAYVPVAIAGNSIRLYHLPPGS
jgi:hypothetical protein